MTQAGGSNGEILWLGSLDLGCLGYAAQVRFGPP